MSVEPEVLVVLVSVPDADVGERLADILVQSKLAACVTQIKGASSTYMWEGVQRRASEDLLLIKTTNARWGSLEETIRAHHPYECPEILAINVAAGSSRYLDWVRTSVKD